MVVVKLQKGTENVMFGHPDGNTFALVSTICWLLNDEAYCCVITRNGPIPQVLERHESNNGNLVLQPRVRLLKIRSILRQGAYDPKGCGVLLV